MEYKYLKDINNILHNLKYLKKELKEHDINCNELVNYTILEDSIISLCKELQEDHKSKQSELDNIDYMIKLIKE